MPQNMCYKPTFSAQISPTPRQRQQTLQNQMGWSDDNKTGSRACSTLPQGKHHQTITTYLVSAAAAAIWMVGTAAITSRMLRTISTASSTGTWVAAAAGGGRVRRAGARFLADVRASVLPFLFATGGRSALSFRRRTSSHCMAARCTFIFSSLTGRKSGCFASHKVAFLMVGDARRERE